MEINSVPVHANPSLPPGGKLIFSSNLELLRNAIIDITPNATPCCYRLMDSKAFLHDKQLRIYEFAEFPNQYGAYYSAVSYVWRGNPLIHDASSPSYWEEDIGSFSVKGAEESDPISCDVLYHTCIAALDSASNAHYLWLDRLCILQSNDKDKAWQIRQMYEIYRYCKMCCILPGGIQRLVTLDEETAWIHRAWTLQEAIIPHRTLVIFMANNERLEQLDRAIDQQVIPCPIVDVIPGLSAYGELRGLLEMSIVDEQSSAIFGKKMAPRAALFGAAIKQQSYNYREKDLKYQAIWRSALMRTSSRPVDMIFSIMGLFGILLDPLDFKRNDRLKATIALAKNIVAVVGEKPHWVAAAYQLDPCRQLSTFPQFPETTVGGSAYLSMSDGSMKEVADVVEERCNIDSWLSGLPEGKMDETGYFTFAAKIVGLVSVGQQQISFILSSDSNPTTDRGRIFVYDKDRSVWEVDNGTGELSVGKATTTFAVYVGRRVSYLELEASKKSFRHVALVVQEHSPGKFHRVTYLELDDNYTSVFKDLKIVEVSVGGPDSVPL